MVLGVRVLDKRGVKMPVSYKTMQKNKKLDDFVNEEAKSIEEENSE